MYVKGIVIVDAECVEVTHRDVWELRERARDLAYQARRKSQVADVVTLAGVVTVVGEPVVTVSYRQDRRRIDGKQVVHLCRIHATFQPPLIRAGDGGEFRIARLQRVIPEIAYAGAPPGCKVLV